MTLPPANPELDKPLVLLVDDDPDMLTMLVRLLSRKFACRVETATSGETALAFLDRNRPDVIITDLRMPGLDGMSLLTQVKERHPEIAVIVMTGYGNVELAVRSLREGAYDFVEKPFDQERIVHSLERCLERVWLLKENRYLQERLSSKKVFCGLHGCSCRMQEVFDLIRKVADTNVTVLIRGESGTGKELAAKALHTLSRRAAKPLVTVNCPALPAEILESELFGYVKGAFTGATQDKTGYFLEADGSTLLLDEIGDLPLSLQTKLLRVLQEKEITPLGQTKGRAVDVRVVASTNQDLEAKIAGGQFREDLFYRLNVVTITMPSLAERPEDIPLLARHFLQKYAAEYDRGDLTFAPATEQELLRRRWKGNIRELQNTVKRAVLLTTTPQITPADLAEGGAGPEETPAAAEPRPTLTGLSYNDAKREILTSFSRDYLTAALRQSGGNVTAAAQSSGLGRQAFQRLLRAFDLKAESFRSEKP